MVMVTKRWAGTWWCDFKDCGSFCWLECERKRTNNNCKLTSAAFMHHPAKSAPASTWLGWFTNARKEELDNGCKYPPDNERLKLPIVIYVRSSLSNLHTSQTRETNTLEMPISKCKWKRNHNPCNSRLEDQSALHAAIRLSRETTFQCIHNDDENSTKKLSSAPADS